MLQIYRQIIQKGHPQTSQTFSVIYMFLFQILIIIAMDHS